MLKVPQQLVFLGLFVTAISGTAQTAPRVDPLGESHPLQTSHLRDWHIRREAPNRLSFGEHCLPTSPCNACIGGVVYQFTNGPWTLTLSNKHAGSIWLYISNTGTLSLGVPTALKGDISTSSSITVVDNVNTQPADALVLGRWDVSDGAFSPSGFMFAAYLSFKPSPIAGPGIEVNAGSRDVIGIDTTSVLRKFICSGGPAASVPAGATLGDICWDFKEENPVMYVCSNANGCAVKEDWKRAGGRKD